MTKECTRPEICIETLTRIDQNVAALQTAVKSLAERQADLHQKMFIGNGSPALVVRLDRLEVQAERRKTNNILLWTTILGILVCIVGERIAAHLDKSAAPTVAAAPSKP